MCSKLSSMPWEDRVSIIRRHFEKKGYRVHSGLQFGCELVLYADDPTKVHSDFCVHLVGEGEIICCRRHATTHCRFSNIHYRCILQDGRLDWRTMQTLVRSMPELHKTLILAHIREVGDGFQVEEMAIATEHAPFRHKSNTKEVGAQVKKKARTHDVMEQKGDDGHGEELECNKG